jgi:O-antigen/teichoic acid export membrane protein
MYRVATALLGASIARYAGQLVVFILIARLRGPADAGIYALALAITAPVFIVAGLGMRSVFLTLRSPISVSNYERLRALTVAGAVIATIVATSIVSPEISVTVAAVSGYKALDALNDLYGAVLQRAMRASATVTTSIAVSAAQALTLAVALLADVPTALALLISTIVSALITVSVVRGKAISAANDAGTPVLDGQVRRPWREIMRAGFPTGVSFGLVTLLSTMPQYFLGATSGASAVGRYAILLYLVVAVEMVLNALSQSWIPYGRHLEAEGRLSVIAILAVAVKWTLITLPLGGASMVAAYFVLPAVLGPAYVLALPEVLPLTLAMVVTPFVFATTTSLSIQNKYRWSLVASAATVFLGVLIGWWLVGQYGLEGGLWTYAICLVLRALTGLGIMAATERLGDFKSIERAANGEGH